MLTFICLNIKYHLEDLIHLLRSIKIYQLIHLTTKFYVKFKLYTQIYINNSKLCIDNKIDLYIIGRQIQQYENIIIPNEHLC